MHVRSVLLATLHVLLLSVSVSGSSVDLERAAVHEYVARNTKVPVILEKGSIVPCRMADEQGGICALCKFPSWQRCRRHKLQRRLANSNAFFPTSRPDNIVWHHDLPHAHVLPGIHLWTRGSPKGRQGDV